MRSPITIGQIAVLDPINSYISVCKVLLTKAIAKTRNKRFLTEETISTVFLMLQIYFIRTIAIKGLIALVKAIGIVANSIEGLVINAPRNRPSTPQNPNIKTATSLMNAGRNIQDTASSISIKSNTYEFISNNANQQKMTSATFDKPLVRYFKLCPSVCYRVKALF